MTSYNMLNQLLKSIIGSISNIQRKEGNPPDRTKKTLIKTSLILERSTIKDLLYNRDNIKTLQNSIQRNARTKRTLNVITVVRKDTLYKNAIIIRRRTGNQSQKELSKSIQLPVIIKYLA